MMDFCKYSYILEFFQNNSCVKKTNQTSFFLNIQQFKFKEYILFMKPIYITEHIYDITFSLTSNS